MIQIVAFLPYCPFLYAIPDRPHENQIWTREVLQLKLSSNWPKIPPLTCSLGLFLLNSGYCNQYLSLGVFFCGPIWHGNVNFMWHFFPNCGNPTRPHTGINPAANGLMVKFKAWEKKITMNCQHNKTIASQIKWIGLVTFSFPLTMLVYLTFLSTNQSFPLKNTTGR